MKRATKYLPDGPRSHRSALGNIRRSSHSQADRIRSATKGQTPKRTNAKAPYSSGSIPFILAPLSGLRK